MSMDLTSLISQEGGLAFLPAFLTSLALGLLIGLERERNPTAKAGLRTFALIAMLGTLVAMLAETMQTPWLLAVAILVVGGIIIGAYKDTGNDEDPGTTTQAALVLCFGLGAIVWYGYDTLAVILAITTTVLLYFKPELHRMSERLTRQDLRSVLQFAVLSFVILPILPNRSLGPFDALNPYQVWLMVVLISGISLAGYVALRLVGQHYGAPLLGFFGGLVSSTATTLIYARHGLRGAGMRQMAVLVILVANLVVLVRLGVIGGAVSPGILSQLAPLLLGGLLPGCIVAFLMWRRMGSKGELPMPQISNPTEMRVALSFGLLYAVVLLAAAWLSDYAGSRGLYLLALVSGLTDVDAITLSSLRLFEQGRIGEMQTVTAVAIAYLANLAFKFGMVFAVGGAVMARLCLWPALAVAAGMGSVLALNAWMV